MSCLDSQHSARHTRGFTLIEVLVSLAIIAIGLGALLSTSGSQANSAAYLKQKTIAHWVAMNELTRLQVERSYPDLGVGKGVAQMSNVDWFWSRDVKATEDPNTRKVSYTVFADKSRKQNLSVLSGYVVRQAQQ